MFIAESGGERRTIEGWSAEDVRLLLDVLKAERKELYETVREIVTDREYKEYKEYPMDENHEELVFREPVSPYGYGWNGKPPGYWGNVAGNGSKGKTSDLGGRTTSEKQTRTFQSKLTVEQLEEMAELVNELGIFASPKPVTPDSLAAFFRCEQAGFRVKNLRLLCALLSRLADHGHIGRYWQAPIYKNRLVRSYEKDGYVNRSDLTTAAHAISSVLMDGRVERIMKAIVGWGKQGVRKHDK